MTERDKHGPSINVRGPMVTALARQVMEAVEKPMMMGMEPEVACGILVALAVDLWRANFGDDDCVRVLKGNVDRRMARPTSEWGGEAREVR